MSSELSYGGALPDILFGNSPKNKKCKNHCNTYILAYKKLNGTIMPMFSFNSCLTVSFMMLHSSRHDL